MKEVAPLQRDYDVVIIGAGVVGCALARELARYDLSIGMVEQAGDVCEGTSKANTAILHTGFDCTPGTLESRLVARGYTLLGHYAEEAGIAVERCGAILVAWDAEQAAALEAIEAKALANGYRDTERLTPEGVRTREPHLGEGIAGGLVVPGEAIIDPWSVPLAFAVEAVSAGVELHLNMQVLGIESGEGGHRLTTTGGEVRAQWLLNAAGLSAAMVDGLCDHHDFSVQPRRGELLVFDKLARGLLSSIILPVPTARTKGVLVSPTVFGNVLLGPTADDVDDPAATATTASGVDRLLAAGHRLLPALLGEEVTAAYAGLRAATESSDYQIHLHEAERYVCVGGIRSTGLTASLAIAEHVVEMMVSAGLEAVERERPPIPQMPPLGERQQRPYLDAVRIAEDPAYGEVLCHCERVTRGEVRDACVGTIPAVDLGGLRRRTRAMNGRCQAFYCGAEVTVLLAELAGIDAAALVGLTP